MGKHTSEDGKGLVVRARTVNASGHSSLIPEVVGIEEARSHIEKMAEELFVIRQDQGAIDRWAQSLANRWQMGIKGKDVEKMAKFVSQITTTLKNMVDAQSFKKQLKTMYFEGLKQELEAQAQLPLAGELARENMRLQLIKVQLQIKEFEDKLEKKPRSQLDEEEEEEEIRRKYKLKTAKMKKTVDFEAEVLEVLSQYRKKWEDAEYPAKDIDDMIDELRRRLHEEKIT